VFRKIKQCPPSLLAQSLLETNIGSFHVLFGIESNIPLCCIVYFLTVSLAAQEAGCSNIYMCGYAHCQNCAAVLHHLS
jgi:hypothetical protein